MTQSMCKVINKWLSSWKQDQFESDAAYYKALGYREEEERLETTDDYVARMTAYMTFYGAIVQVTNASSL